MKREKSDELAKKSTGMAKSSSMDEPGTSKIPQPRTGIPVLRQTGGSLIPSPIGPTAIATGSPMLPPKGIKIPVPATSEVAIETKIVRETVKYSS